MHGIPYNDLKDEDKKAEIDDKVSNEKGGLMGAAMVSDAFFPFRDGVDVGLREGVTSDQETTTSPLKPATRLGRPWSIPGREVLNINPWLTQHKQHLYKIKSPAKPLGGAFFACGFFSHALILNKNPQLWIDTI